MNYPKRIFCIGSINGPTRESWRRIPHHHHHHPSTKMTPGSLCESFCSSSPLHTTHLDGVLLASYIASARVRWALLTFFYPFEMIRFRLAAKKRGEIHRTADDVAKESSSCRGVDGCAHTVEGCAASIPSALSSERVVPFSAVRRTGDELRRADSRRSSLISQRDRG